MSTYDRRQLPPRAINPDVRGPNGEDAVMIESLDVVPGQTVTLEFEQVGPRWRQGVFLGTAGTLHVGDTKSPSVVLWSDASPSQVAIDIEDSDGRLVLYNVWDSGRGRGRFESQSATSGMLVEELGNGSFRYACTDIGVEPDFSRIVFRVSIE